MAKQTKSLYTSSELVFSNIDLLTEIFLRLPPKTLIRIKAVSKRWLSLISDPEFSITHTRQYTVRFPISDFYYNDHRNDVSISLDGHCKFSTLPFVERVRRNNGISKLNILDSRGGLLLCQATVSKLPLIVLNPTTQNYKVLPDPPYYVRRPPDMPFGMFLAFEPSKSHQYKVLIWDTVICNHPHFSISIFSSEIASWKLSGVTVPAGTNRATSFIFGNGAIHWLDTSNFHWQFDVDAEVITYNQLPPEPEIRSYADYFGESNGRLFLIQHRRRGALGFQLLELNRDFNCWVTRHLVDIRPLALQFPRILSKSKVLYVKTGADMGSFSMILATAEKIFLYELKKGREIETEIKVIGEFLKEIYSDYLGHCNLVHPFVQSLALV